MIILKQKGDFSRTTNYFERLKEFVNMSILDEYGRKGVEALQSATPFKTGKTASSWSYEIEHKGQVTSLVFKNSNTNKGVNIAIILQYGHGTRNGGYVEGRDYINPVIRPLFDEIANEAWREVTKV